MKNSLMLAGALATSCAIASPSDSSARIGQILTDRLINYVGLSEEMAGVDLLDEKTESPVVKTFGYETTSLSENGLIGYELGLNADLGWNYELPLYNQDQFLVFRQRVAAFGGGRQYVSLTFYFFKLTLFLDLWLSKFTMDSYLRYDIVNYSDYCNAGQWLLDVARASVLFQLDVNECIWGLVGSITSNTEDCEWGTYYINQPILDYSPLFETMTGTLYANTCDDQIPTYDG